MVLIISQWSFLLCSWRLGFSMLMRFSCWVNYLKILCYCTHFLHVMSSKWIKMHQILLSSCALFSFWISLSFCFVKIVTEAININCYYIFLVLAVFISVKWLFFSSNKKVYLLLSICVCVCLIYLCPFSL